MKAGWGDARAVVRTAAALSARFFDSDLTPTPGQARTMIDLGVRHGRRRGS